MMSFLSTRGADAGRTLSDVIMSGVASDGGLYVPSEWPTIDWPKEAQPSLTRIGEAIFAGFADDIATVEVLQQGLQRYIDSCAGEEQLPLTPLAEFQRSPDASHEPPVGNAAIAELWHGPTLSFKDVALQSLGSIYDALLMAKDERSILLVATSGDTGSAAMAAVANCELIDAFVLFPRGKVSELQEAQMTTLASDRVHALEVEGDFDDCQRIVKALLRNTEWVVPPYRLLAANSINFGRILYQLCMYAWIALQRPGTHVIVPTGNLGSGYAAWIARRLGAPIGTIVMATNSNDPVHQLLSKGVYQRTPAVRTAAPAMDITTASNGERLLFEAMGRDCVQLVDHYDMWSAGHPVGLLGPVHKKLTQGMKSTSTDDAEIARVQNAWRVDPHCATAVSTLHCHPEWFADDAPVTIMGTAHWSKFVQAAQPEADAHAERLEQSISGARRKSQLKASVVSVRRHIQATLGLH